MPYLFIIVVLLVLGGCVSPQQRYAQAYAECQATASRYNLGDAYQQFMQQCVAMTPGPAQAQQYFNQAANAYGPYGAQGPSWESFNRQFDPTFQPHQPPRYLVTPPHSPGQMPQHPGMIIPQ